ncbi:MAG: phosphoglycerate mutase [Hyphomicrobiales bacterium]|nr:phosphoglycerate mutase [Hyphomicrobiales bacterium]
MRRLILLRHSKAAAQAGGGDFERPLTHRGRKDASRAGRALKEAGLLPDTSVVSNAKRTRETLERVLEEFGEKTPVHVESRLYNADVGALISALHKTPASVRTLLVVGHNPGIAELAETLAGTGDRYARARLQSSFPTSAFAVLDFDVDSWTEVDIGTGRLDRFVVPEDLTAKD